MSTEVAMSGNDVIEDINFFFTHNTDQIQEHLCFAQNPLDAEVEEETKSNEGDSPGVWFPGQGTRLEFEKT